MYVPGRPLLGFSRKQRPMSANEILQEAKKLHKIGDELEVLADQNPPIEEALTVILGNVHNTANLLKVAVALKIGTPAELDTIIH
jgi:biotin synthase-like enzyme